MELSGRIDVEASLEQVWEVLREVERWPEWAPTVTSIRRLDDGPLALGSRVRVAQPRIPPTEYVGTAPEPLTCVATGPGVRTTRRHLLEELGSGNTRVTLAVDVVAVSFTAACPSVAAGVAALADCLDAGVGVGLPLRVLAGREEPRAWSGC